MNIQSVLDPAILNLGYWGNRGKGSESVEMTGIARIEIQLVLVLFLDDGLWVLENDKAI